LRLQVYHATSRNVLLHTPTYCFDGTVNAVSLIALLLCVDCSRFGGKKSAIDIDSSIWREEIGNRNRLFHLAGRNSLPNHAPCSITPCMLCRQAVTTMASSNTSLLIAAANASIVLALLLHRSTVASSYGHSVSFVVWAFAKMAVSTSSSAEMSTILIPILLRELRYCYSRCSAPHVGFMECLFFKRPNK
jgi:hypothetical protein